MAGWTKAITDPLKAASDMAQAMLELRDTVKLGELVIKLNAQILAAQRGALAASQSEGEMADEIRSLKAKIASFEKWETEKGRYEMKSLSYGSIVYALRPEEGADVPTHYICANCYGNRMDSILQRVPGNAAASYLSKPPTLRCPKCKSEVIG